MLSYIYRYRLRKKDLNEIQDININWNYKVEI